MTLIEEIETLRQSAEGSQYAEVHMQVEADNRMLDKVLAIINKRMPVCDDEGCPYYGTPHGHGKDDLLPNNSCILCGKSLNEQEVTYYKSTCNSCELKADYHAEPKPDVQGVDEAEIERLLIPVYGSHGYATNLSKSLTKGTIKALRPYLNTNPDSITVSREELEKIGDALAGLHTATIAHIETGIKLGRIKGLNKSDALYLKTENALTIINNLLERK